LKPKKRSARTVRKTRPPEMTAWTSDSGASASAATCSDQAPSATSIPSVNHLERNRPAALASGCFSDTSGAAQAPRCLKRKPTLVASAHSKERRIPIWMVN
jgi:hypothetical protein